MNARLRDDRIEHLRVPPNSVDAEQAVLGGLMLVPEKVSAVASKLSPDDFYRRDHRLIYEAILGLEAKGKPFDVVTLGEWFDGSGAAEKIGGSSYLIELAMTTPSAANIEYHADIVRTKATMRRAIAIGTELVNGGFTGNDGAVDTAIRELMELAKVEQRCEYSMRDALRLAWADAEEAYKSQGALRGVPSGFIDVDRRLGGWHKSDLIFIGARPSMGKTALMVNLAEYAAEAGKSVGMISGEQGAMQIGQRTLAMSSRMAAERLRNGDIDDECWGHVSAAMARLRDRTVRIYDRSAPTLDDICRIARKWKQEYGLEVLFVDYLQRIRHPKADNRIDEVSEVARGLKTLARDLEIPVVCLAQVKAIVDTRPGDKRPSLGDIANSDEATREADLIAFLYRDEVYNDDTRDKGIAELNVEKNRHGPTGQFRLRFTGESMRFDNLAKDRPDQYATSGRDRAAGAA